jgi:hypothetical protein
LFDEYQNKSPVSTGTGLLFNEQALIEYLVSDRKLLFNTCRRFNVYAGKVLSPVQADYCFSKKLAKAVTQYA